MNDTDPSSATDRRLEREDNAAAEDEETSEQLEDAEVNEDAKEEAVQ